MSTVVKLSQIGRLGKPRATSEWSVKDAPAAGICVRLEEWANELRRDWFRASSRLHRLPSTNV